MYHVILLDPFHISIRSFLPLCLLLSLALCLLYKDETRSIPMAYVCVCVRATLFIATPFCQLLLQKKIYIYLNPFSFPLHFKIKKGNFCNEKMVKIIRFLYIYKVCRFAFSNFFVCFFWRFSALALKLN